MSKKQYSRKAKVIALSLSKSAAGMIGLVTAIFMARLLTKEDFAAYHQTLLAYAFFSPLFQLGLSQGIYYFLPSEKIRIRGRVVDSIFILSGMGVLMAFFILLGGNQLLAARFSNPQVASLLLWLIPYTIITLPANLNPNVLVAREQVMMASTFAVIKQLIIGISTIIPIIIWQNAQAPLIGNVAASILMGSVAIALMLRATPNDSGKPSLTSMSEMIRFSFPLGLGAMIGALSLGLDKVIVGFLETPEVFAVYVLGAIEIPLIAVVTGSITAVLIVEMRRAVAEDNIAEAVRLFRLTAEKTSYILLPAMLFFMVTAEVLVVMFFGEAYRESATPFRIYLLLLPFRTINFGALLVSLGANVFILKRSLIGLTVNLVLSIILVKLFGAWGAAVATVITIILWSVLASTIFLVKKTGYNWTEFIPIRQYIKIFIATMPVILMSALLVHTLKEHHPAIAFWAASGVTGSFLLFYWNGVIYDIRKIPALTKRNMEK